MWFNKEGKADKVTTRASGRGRKGDMRSELGLSNNDYAQATHARATRRVGASKVVTQDAAGNTYNEDVLLNDLKVRARRRLIGALVLLAAAFVVLPWVFDDNRKQAAPMVTVVIPEKSAQFDVQNPRVTTGGALVAVDNLKPANNKSESTAANTKSDEKLEVKPESETKTENKLNTDKTTKVAESSKFIVHIGIVSSKNELDALKARLSSKGVKPTVESIMVNGVNKSRVRLGPFDSMSGAQAAADKIRGAAKNPVVIEVK